MASAVVDLLIGKIAVLLENEVYLLAGVRGAVKDIQLELKAMRAFLEDADQKQSTSEVEKDWVDNVRDMTYEIEDIIDEFIYYMSGQRTDDSPLTRYLYNVIRFPQNLWVRHKTAAQLQTIKKTIEELPIRTQRYGINQINNSNPRSDNNWKQFQAEGCLFIQEDELVGISNDKEMLTSLLTDGYSNQTVISVLGMGGSGKTTLVAKTYSSDTVTRYFNCYSWITVSQTYVLEDLIRCLIKDFHKTGKELVPADLDTMRPRELLEKMVSYLRDKRYLLVLDDVWDIKLWNELRAALPDSPFGSRILITTRKEDIATHGFGVRSYVHRVLPLERGEAWMLFCKKAFYNHPDNLCTEELEPFARVLVEKCEGLPLALVALGGLMFSKKNVSEWRKICDSLNWHMANNPVLESMKTILLISFNELPYYLKRCFLYFSIFPEDYIIHRNRLIRLWMGEGFVDAREGIPEEIANEYLMELTFRSMLQVVQRDTYGMPKACKMHDLMREIAITISKKEKFCIFKNWEEEIDGSGTRRLSIQFQKVDKKAEIKFSSDMSNLRSLLLIYPRKYLKDPLLRTILLKFKLLKVLDLKDVPIDNLSDATVKKLFNLRYLNIKRTLIKELPSSIGRLRHLETLDLRNTKIEVLPKEVGKLKNLRHLFMYRYSDDSEFLNFGFMFGLKAPKSICKLKNLQSLYIINVEKDIVMQLGNMTQLTSIGVANVEQKDGKDLCESVQKMRRLQLLIVIASNEEEVLEMDSLSSPPPQLKTLLLVGKLQRVPLWLLSLQNLSELILIWTRLTEDFLPHIAALPWLHRLTMSNAYVTEKLCFREGFPKLTDLNLYNMPELCEVEIKRGVMPDVSNIELVALMKLRRVPSGIEYLTQLKTLSLLSVPIDLIETIDVNGEANVDRSRVEHIPNIDYFYKSGGKYEEKHLSHPSTLM